MKRVKIGHLLEMLAGSGAIAVLALTIYACSGQQEAPQTQQDNQIAMSFDLSKCQALGPSLYQCPGSDKAICDPGYNKGDVECIKVDKTGVTIQTQ